MPDVLTCTEVFLNYPSNAYLNRICRVCHRVGAAIQKTDKHASSQLVCLQYSLLVSISNLHRICLEGAFSIHYWCLSLTCTESASRVPSVFITGSIANLHRICLEGVVAAQQTDKHASSLLLTCTESAWRVAPQSKRRTNMHQVYC